VKAVHEFYNIFVLQITQGNYLLPHHLAVDGPSLNAQFLNCYVTFINLVVHKIYYPEAPLAEFLFEFELTVPDLVVKVLAKRVV